MRTRWGQVPTAPLGHVTWARAAGRGREWLPKVLKAAGPQARQARPPQRKTVLFGSGTDLVKDVRPVGARSWEGAGELLIQEGLGQDLGHRLPRVLGAFFFFNI